MRRSVSPTASRHAHAGRTYRSVVVQRGVLLAAVFMLLSGCQALDDELAATRTSVSASPTITHTPSGDRLTIDGEIVRSVLIPDVSQDALYALTDRDLYHLLRGHWEPTGAGNDGRWLLLDPNDPERILRGNHPDCTQPPPEKPIRFDISEDGGLRWRVHFQGANVRPLIFDTALPGVVFGIDCGLAISSSQGRMWKRFQPFENHHVIDLTISEDMLYVLGFSKEGNSQVRAVDVTDPDEPIFGEPLLDVTGKATIDARGGRIVVGALDAVHISDDAGVTWASSRIGLEQITVPPTTPPEDPPIPAVNPQRGIQVIRIQPGNIHRMYAGTAHGVYVSQDDGVTWVRYPQVPIDANVIDLQFALDGADLYVTTTTGVIVVPAP